MAKLIAKYRRPDDVSAFEQHYFKVHVPLAKKLPGLTRYEVNAGAVSDASWYLVAVLTFESYEAMTAAMESEAGIAARADLENFAGAGVEVLSFDTKEV
ncbi:EthD family reductase [Paraburkholderia caribensis]|uniref:EthD family reductase n=1 Tax=Paraburkholderia TaxID=1822464 RepID=UPI001CB52D91|nr:EthD family reductase [Paraburkholderia caribensis]BEU25641.1 EthD family reductase [Paraburkholderia sp. 22B1P]CAG9262437.1 EthD domain-containing protein [Paraburkholderia caribensis]